MSPKHSVERLKNSRVEVDRFRFKLEDRRVADIFRTYEEFSTADQRGGTLVLVKGRDKDNIETMHLVIQDARGRVRATANDSHPCPPFTDC